MTNELGHRLAASRSEDRGDKYSGITLGAYRRGKGMPWCPGATIDVWTACASQDVVTGVSWPHAYFVQTIGDPAGDGGHILCPGCRERRRETLLLKEKTGVMQPTAGQMRLF